MNVRAAIQERLGDFGVPAPGGHVEGGAVFGRASRTYLRSCLNQCADNVAATNFLAFVGHAVQRCVPAGGLHIGVDAKAEEQFDDPQVSVGCCVVKEGPTVPVIDMSERWIGQQFASDVFQQGVYTGSDHKRQDVRKDGAVARESELERWIRCQLEHASCIMKADGKHKIVQHKLFGPALRNFAVNGVFGGRRWRGLCGRRWTGVYEVSGRSLKEIA